MDYGEQFECERMKTDFYHADLDFFDDKKYPIFAIRYILSISRCKFTFKPWAKVHFYSKCVSGEWRVLYTNIPFGKPPQFLKVPILDDMIGSIDFLQRDHVGDQPTREDFFLKDPFTVKPEFK